ncbi:MAG TPA: AsmA family protein [Methyloceanibacter sp.]|nr:AsmA family protein [Methyloceanibacter sp.]
MRITLFGLAAIAVIGVAIVFVGPLFISTDDLRDRLLAQVESATGYRLRVSGPVKVALFPSLDLVAKDIGVAQGGESKGPEMATAKELRFGLQLSSLFGGKVKMTEVTLIDPVIALPRTQNAAGADTDGSALAGLKTLSLDKLHIENGTLILPPSAGAPGKRIEALTLDASLPSIDAPISFEGSAVVDGKEMRASGSIGELGRFLDGGAVPVTLNAAAPAMLEGEASLNGIATYQGGTLALSQFTLRAGDKALAGSASYKKSLLTLHPLTLNAGGNSLSGSAVADLSGAVPAVNAAFSGQALNLDALLGQQGTSLAVSEGAPQAGWSDARIDFAPLRGVTAKLKLSTGALTYGGIRIAQANLIATISGGKLAASLPNFKLYDGAGTLNLTVDASGKVPAQRIRLSLVNFSAYPFLKDAAGFENLEGTGAITLDLATSGASQRAMVSGLGGTAKFDFADGAIRGINIAKTIRSLSTGILSGWQENAAEKTDFATLGASFKVAKGQAETSDLRLAGPLVRMAGAGSVNVPSQTLKLRVNPELVASLEGQGGKDLKGLGVPVVISGPWASPSIYPDIEGILTDPVAAYEQLNRLGGGLAALPGAASNSGIGALIKDGSLAPDSLQNGAISGIGQLLGAKAPADEASPPDAAVQEPASEAETVAPPKKTGKKREARAQPALRPEDAAAQALQNFFGN